MRNQTRVNPEYIPSHESELRLSNLQRCSPLLLDGSSTIEQGVHKVYHHMVWHFVAHTLKGVGLPDLLMLYVLSKRFGRCNLISHRPFHYVSLSRSVHTGYGFGLDLFN